MQMIYLFNFNKAIMNDLFKLRIYTKINSLSKCGKTVYIYFETRNNCPRQFKSHVFGVLVCILHIIIIIINKFYIAHISSVLCASHLCAN